MNRIEEENQHPGTTSWQNTNASVDSRRRSTGIEGYCTRTSLAAGDTLEVCVSSTIPSCWTSIEWAFMGGRGAAHAPEPDHPRRETQTTRQLEELQLRDCDWPASLRFRIPDDWLSGVYIGKLTQVEAPTPTQSYVIFVVRDERPCDFLFKCSDMTWSAYNGWPDDYSLYDFHGTNPKIGYWGPGIQVSFDRPYAMAQPWYGHARTRTLRMDDRCESVPDLRVSASLLDGIARIRCLIHELHGSSSELSMTLRQRAKALLATGHDEYYSVAMYDNLKGAVETWQDMPQNGLSVGFFCGGSLTGVTDITPPLTNPDRGDRVIRRIGRWGPIEPWLLALRPNRANSRIRLFPTPENSWVRRLVDPGVGVADWICTNTQGSLGVPVLQWNRTRRRRPYSQSDRPRVHGEPGGPSRGSRYSPRGT